MKKKHTILGAKNIFTPETCVLLNGQKKFLP